MSEENFNNQQDQNQEENANIPEQDEKQEQPIADREPCQAPKKARKVSLTAFICSCVSLVLAAVMLTYALCSNAYLDKLAKVEKEHAETGETQEDRLSYDIGILNEIFESYSFEDLDDEALREAVLKAYVHATGDRYAQYYTREEFAALLTDMGGESQGIGINIINSEIDVSGVVYKALKIINVIKGSPAEAAGLKSGDCVIAVGTFDENTTINQLGYDMALKELQGTKGTRAEFIAYRPSTEKTEAFSIMRDSFEATSVMYTVADSAVGKNIGIVKIIEFDLTTPTQLDSAIESLKAAGCDKFVFDVRYNPGGELSSIVACLSRFLSEGDTVISVKDKLGDGEVTKVAPVNNPSGCSVLAEDIGKYKDLNTVVLCNESTASAAELFVANFRDYKLGDIIGTKTYGKGSMQSHINLAYFGCEGVLKMTRYMYYPPSGVSYDGIGIEPTHTVTLSDEARGMSIYDIMGKDKDNQLTEAVKYFK